MIGDCQWLRATDSSTAIVAPLPVLPANVAKLSDDDLDDLMRLGYRQLAAANDPILSTSAVVP